MPSCADDPSHGQTRRLLFRGLGICVVDFRCRAHVEPLGKEEPNPTHSIVFVRRGVFARTDRTGSLVADANQILFFNEGQPYRYAHPLPGGDDCTIVTLEDDCARATSERFALSRAPDRDGPFPVGCALSSSRAARLHYELLAKTSGDRAEPELAVQDTVAELIDETMVAMHRTTVVRAKSSPATMARRRELVDAAKLILSGSIGTPPSLSELAATLGCSPFHLSRIFRLTTGLALRQYVRRLRTVLAADQIRQGHDDLTSLALDLGFSDHSHFTNSFRQEWGIPPSRIRRGGRGRI